MARTKLSSRHYQPTHVLEEPQEQSTDSQEEGLGGESSSYTQSRQLVLAQQRREQIQETAVLQRVNVSQGRRGRRLWTEQETNSLIEGCRKHGVGSWSKILHDRNFHFDNRTSGDLKDKFRTLFPNESRHGRLMSRSARTDSQISMEPPPAFRIFRRRERRYFSAEEDRRLLAGVRKHGCAWTRIANDPEIGFVNQRKGTDLRDRFRNAFPQEYAKMGFTLPFRVPLHAINDVNALYTPRQILEQENNHMEIIMQEESPEPELEMQKESPEPEWEMQEEPPEPELEIEEHDIINNEDEDNDPVQAGNHIINHYSRPNKWIDFSENEENNSILNTPAYNGDPDSPSFDLSISRKRKILEDQNQAEGSKRRRE
ncbi:10894_t:CDS:2 [Ambispora gerdemannii]|uniref:10894_t:CDS:1 n=1 Tax=Ambispora gerdemannii TaxID=144530 RepID=A0A9N8V2M6_9GLOM|nr:10894_t:CDS:2 [Ambispora gerdemannii]